MHGQYNHLLNKPTQTVKGNIGPHRTQCQIGAVFGWFEGKKIVFRSIGKER